MYGNVESIKENGGGIIYPGIHTVSIDSIKPIKIETANFNGMAADVTFKKSSGESLTERLFEFKFEEGKKNFKGEVQDMAAQWKFWQESHLATFKQATSNFDAMITELGKAADFNSWIAGLSSCVKSNGGKELEIRVTGDKKGYSKYRFRFDSAAEAGSGSLKWNPEVHDQRPAKAENTEQPVAQEAESDDLPF
jgi:hypothetical protein